MVSSRSAHVGATTQCSLYDKHFGRMGVAARGEACLAAFCSARTIWLRTQIALPQELASKSQKRLYYLFLGFCSLKQLASCARKGFTHAHRRFFADQIGSLRNAPNQASPLAATPIKPLSLSWPCCEWRGDKCRMVPIRSGRLRIFVGDEGVGAFSAVSIRY